MTFLKQRHKACFIVKIGRFTNVPKIKKIIFLKKRQIDVFF